jgi:hypothetical protein
VTAGDGPTVDIDWSEDFPANTPIQRKFVDASVSPHRDRPPASDQARHAMKVDEEEQPMTSSSATLGRLDPRELVDFHRPAYKDWRWLETCWFSFFVPDRGMRVHLRAAFRSELGVAQTMVAIYSRSGGVLDMDFWDNQAHQPIGYNRYSDFSLPSGLSVKGMPAPEAYRVTYASKCRRVEIDVRCQALMPPLDLPSQALPSDAPGFAAFHRQPQGDVGVGHIDQTFHVTGSLCLDGEAIAVDSISNHDHSWSPRSEFRSACGTFDEFHFGERLTLLAQTSQRRSGEASVTHAYVLVDGEVRTLRSAKASFDQEGYTTRACTYELVDEHGVEYTITADVEHAIAQDQGSNGFTVMNLCRAKWDGQVGVAESMWHWDIPEMQRLIRSGRAESGNAELELVPALEQGRRP